MKIKDIWLGKRLRGDVWFYGVWTQVKDIDPVVRQMAVGTGLHFGHIENRVFEELKWFVPEARR